MNIIKNLTIALIVTFFVLNNTMAERVSVRPTAYINKVFKLQLCEVGSTLANCLNPLIIGQSAAGKEMDLSVVGSANSFGKANLIPSGVTYTHAQVIMSRSVTVAGSVTTSAATCNTGGTAATNSAGGATDNGTVENQTLVAFNGTNHGDEMNSTSAITGGTDAAAGTLDNAHDFMKFRWLLVSPLNVTAGNIPSITISFDLSGALTFDDTATNDDGGCDTNSFFLEKPAITNSFN